MLKRFCQCLGLASLILVMNYGDLLGGGGDVRMHVPFRLTAICLAQAADILLLSLVLFLVLTPLRRWRFYPWVRLGIAVLVPPYLINRTQALYPFDVTGGFLTIFTVAWAALLLLLLLRFPRGYRGVIRVGDALAIFFAVFGFTSLGQLLWVATWQPGPQQHTPTWANAAQPPFAASAARVDCVR